MTTSNHSASVRTTMGVAGVFVLSIGILGCPAPGGGTTPPVGSVGCAPLSADVTTDTTLSAGCYDVTKDIFVENGATLTIAPGATLFFQQDTGLQVSSDGILIAAGTAADPILFTGEQRIRGFWDGVYFRDSISFDNRMDHVTVECAGGRDFAFGAQGNLVVQGFSTTAVRVNVTNCTLRESGSYGFYFDSQAVVDGFGNNTVTSNTLGAGYVFANVGQILDASGTYTGNDVDVVIVDGNSVDLAQTWEAIDIDYLMDGRTFVDAALTIAAGARLVFRQDASLEISDTGALIAVGTAADPIVMTGEQPIRGFWAGVYFRDSGSFDNRMDFVTVEHAGGRDFAFGAQGNVVAQGFSTTSVRVNVTNCTLRESSSYGFYFDNQAVVDGFGNNTVTSNTLAAGYVFANVAQILDASGTYTGNDVDVVIVDGNSVDLAQTWEAIDIDYLMDGRTFVDAALTIAAGARLVFRLDASLEISDTGALIAVGTAADPIVMTGEQPIAGFWAGVYFRDSGSIDNRMDFVTVEYAGGRNFALGAQGNVVLQVFGTTLAVRATITNCTLQQSSSWGLWASTEAFLNPNVETANTFLNNASGDFFREP